MLNNSSNNIAALLQYQASGTGNTDQVSVSSQSATAIGSATGSTSSSIENKLQMAAKIARWAPGSLSNYYNTRERLNMGGGGTVGGTTTANGGDSAGGQVATVGRRLKSSLRKHHHPTTTATTTVGSGSVSSSSSSAVGGGSSRSVSSGAPYATGSNFE